jgi:hypothetical protein
MYISAEIVSQHRLQEYPSLSIEPSGSVIKNAGDEVRLVCSARGDPAPDVAWEKIGEYLPEKQVTILYI